MDAGERRLLATMPLHAITTLHGEAGLRERLAIETASFPEAGGSGSPGRWTWPPGCTPPTGGSASPYIDHLLRITSHYRIHDPNPAAAALLYDTVEDHPPNSPPAAASKKHSPRSLPGSATGRRAGGHRHQPRIQARPRQRQQYRDHVASLETSPWARGIKISDITDNGAGLIHITGPMLENSPPNTHHWSRHYASWWLAPTPRWPTTSRPTSTISSTAQPNGFAVIGGPTNSGSCGP